MTKRLTDIHFKKISKVIAIFLVWLLLACPNIHAQLTKENDTSALNKFKTATNLPTRVTTFYNLPNRYIQNSAYDWLEVVNVYLNGAEKIRDTNAIISYKLMQSQLFNDIADFDKSIAIANETLKLTDSLSIDNTNILLRLLDNSYGELQLYDKQIEVRETMKAKGIVDEVAFFDIYANMGLYRKAMKEYIRAIGPTIEDSDAFARAKYQNRIGVFLKKDQSASTAIKQFRSALGYLEVYVNDIEEEKSEKDIYDSEFLKAEIEGNIGQCYVLLNEYETATPLLEGSSKKLETHVGNDFQSILVDNALAYAEAQLQLDNEEEANNTLEALTGEMNIAQQLKRNKLLADYHYKIENFKNATQYLKKNERISDSVKANERSILKQQLVAIVGTSDLENSRKLINEQKLANERFRNEIQAKDERIFLVYISLVFILLGFAGLVYAYVKSIKNQRLIAEQKHLIENSLREKDSLLKEIHHRVKNNLQMVSSLLSLQTRNTKSKAAIVALEEGKSRVKAMALIHQKLYQNDDLSFIEMQGYIESLINSVQSVYKKGGHNINITVDAEGTELDIDRAIPFGLILNELVSNTFKYAFPDGDENGKIYIHLRKNGEQGYFEYADNGKGLPDDMDEKTNSSMGLRLINRLVNQLQSKLNIDKSADGVRFWFDFK